MKLLSAETLSRIVRLKRLAVIPLTAWSSYRHGKKKVGIGLEKWPDQPVVGIVVAVAAIVLAQRRRPNSPGNDRIPAVLTGLGTG
ncbi:hypothetical protein [Streptosporangium sp. KLBMP 9127]|nr:hypothetical protein [Streptosporangium sp. KLBMP 9127]